VNAPQVNVAIAYVGLGSNLDSPRRHLEAAVHALDALSGTRVLARSSLYRTAPVGYADQPDFINAVVKLSTALPARALLDALLAVEAEHGRVRRVQDGPRTLDLDLLLHGATTVSEPGLEVPHPRMHVRAFVMVPLVEIAPDLVIPGVGDVRALADRLAREQRVDRLPADVVA
jgi:2-amino-4-hydroxy-6-hydroxymethyldihydropteridine diphosphokinase